MASPRTSPASTALDGFPVMGGHNQPSAAPSTYPITVHFPAAGAYRFELDYFTGSAASMSLVLTYPQSDVVARGGGKVFITGHDPDYHDQASGNAVGAARMIQRSIGYVTNDKPSPHLLLVTGRRNPQVNSEHLDPVRGLNFAGFNGFDIADDGTAGNGILDLHTVNLSDYDAIVVSSDDGGWLTQAELDVLNARHTDLAAYISNGGGLVAFAEGSPLDAATSHDRFGFVPCIASSVGSDQTQAGFIISAQGVALGFQQSDLNDNLSHNIFPTNNCGLDVID